MIYIQKTINQIKYSEDIFKKLSKVLHMFHIHNFIQNLFWSLIVIAILELTIFQNSINVMDSYNNYVQYVIIINKLNKAMNS